MCLHMASQPLIRFLPLLSSMCMQAVPEQQLQQEVAACERHPCCPAKPVGFWHQLQLKGIRFISRTTGYPGTPMTCGTKLS